MSDFKLLVLFSFFALIFTTGDCNVPLKNLTSETLNELWQFIKYPINIKPDCPILNDVVVKYFVFTRNEPEGREVLSSNPDDIGKDRKVVMLIHGWLGSSKLENMVALKDAYLKRYDSAVVMVDWNATAAMPYTRAACDVPITAQYISNFLCLYTGKTGVQLSEIHVVAHSIGAHIAGVAGNNVINRCKQTLGRITGLDPTNALFFRIPEKDRLDATDALFVDVILTHSGYFGYIERLGHVHFSPNCALEQPRCLATHLINNDTLVSDAICSHLRSIDYMTESVNSDQLIAISCSLCPRSCSKDISSQVYQVMGEDCRAIPKPAKNFLIPTNSSSPYALGKTPYTRDFQDDLPYEQSKITNLLLDEIDKL